MAVDSVIANAAPQITGAIRQAARSTGISFEYLLTAAQIQSNPIQSNLNPTAQASTSSAKGLYQIIDQTWLSTMKGAGLRTAMAAMPTSYPGRRTDATTWRIPQCVRRSCGCATIRARAR
jgi:hypothetical protein